MKLSNMIGQNEQNTPLGNCKSATYWKNKIVIFGGYTAID